MGSVRFKLANDGHPFAPCKCGNAEAFVAHSERGGEDFCDQWITCGECGHDPTEWNTGERVESVWGGLDKNAITAAMYATWPTTDPDTPEGGEHG